MMVIFYLLVYDIQSHQSTKYARVLWSNTLNRLISVGFGKNADRQILVCYFFFFLSEKIFKAWDLRDTTKPIISHVIDQSGFVYFFYILLVFFL
jgi:hypothetical protein